MRYFLGAGITGSGSTSTAAASPPARSIAKSRVDNAACDNAAGGEASLALAEGLTMPSASKPVVEHMFSECGRVRHVLPTFCIEKNS